MILYINKSGRAKMILSIKKLAPPKILFESQVTEVTGCHLISTTQDSLKLSCP